MTVSVMTDNETDRILSLRASSRTPLPPEVSMMPPERAELFFRRRAYYGLMGVDDHPLVRYLEGADILTGMAETLAHASHLDRVSHYSAWADERPPVRIYRPDGSEVDPRGRGRRTRPRPRPSSARRRQAAAPHSDADEP